MHVFVTCFYQKHNVKDSRAVFSVLDQVKSLEGKSKSSLKSLKAGTYCVIMGCPRRKMTSVKEMW